MKDPSPALLLAQLERHPLSSVVHRRLAAHFDRVGDVLRATLYDEVANALDGDPFAEPLCPKGTLTNVERYALRHPDLKGPLVEALALCGPALVAGAAPDEEPGPRPFSMEAGKGAPLAGQALLDAVRLLGQRAPDVVLMEDGPPFSLVHGDPVRVAVGRAAVRRPLPPAELRFYAGRALFALSPDLLALRLLRAGELGDGLQLAVDALVPRRLPPGAPAEQKRVLRRVAPKARERFAELTPALARIRPAWERLASAARASCNRAGLLAAGGVAPALEALYAKRAGKEEIVELVRFAVSDRHVRMRAARR